MHGLAVYVKEGLLFAENLSSENSEDSYLCSRLPVPHLLFYFFFLYWSPSSSLCTIFDAISSNIVEVFSIRLFANVFFLGDFNIHHKDWLTFSFAASCAAAIAHRNHFFRLYQQNKSASKVKFRQVSNRCKKVLETARLAFADKKNKVYLFQETWITLLLANGW